MSMTHSPKIVTTDLAFYYDMANKKKSFLGVPTTNYVTYPYAGWNGTSFALTYDYDATATRTQTYVTGVSNPVDAPGVMRYSTGTTGYKYFAIRITPPSISNYRFSYYARILSGSPSNLSNSQLWRNDDGFGSVIDETVTGDWNPTFTNDWKRYSMTGPIGSTLDFFPIHSGSLAGGYVVEFCGFQLESVFNGANYPTTFTVGTRSSTQSVVDLTGNTTLTVSALEAIADNNFKFGGGAKIYSSTSLFNKSNGNPLTVAVWMKPERNAGQYQDILVNRSDATYNWMLYQHTTDGSIQLHGSAQNKSTYIPTLNTWIYVVATVSASGNYILYVNGVVQQTVTGFTYFGGAPSLLTIGMFGTSSEPYLGQISAAQIYNRDLSAIEVNQNFNALRGRYGV